MTDETAPEPAPLPPLRIEPARSSRSKCKTCRRPIAKDDLRLGIRIEGPFGEGFLWHHLRCAAKREWAAVEAAYAGRAWDAGVEPPPLESLEREREKAEAKRQEKRTLPYVEIAPSGRSKCKHSGEPIAKGAPRVVLGRKVEFYGQERVGPIAVLPRHVADALAAEDSGTAVEGFEEALRANSAGVDPSVIDAVLAEIGPIGYDRA